MHIEPWRFIGWVAEDKLPTLAEFGWRVRGNRSPAVSTSDHGLAVTKLGQMAATSASRGKYIPRDCVCCVCAHEQCSVNLFTPGSVNMQRNN